MKRFIIQFQSDIERSLQSLGWNGSLQNAQDRVDPVMYRWDPDNSILTIEVALDDIAFSIELTPSAEERADWLFRCVHLTAPI